MSTTISTWVEKERQSIEKWSKDPVGKEESHLVISALESLLNGQLSGSATATRINEILVPRLIYGTRADVGGLWGKLAGMTRYFGATHTQQLVDLHIAIKNLPDIINNAGHVVTYGGKVIWRQMPDWGWIFFEHGLDLDLQSEDPYDEWHAQAPGKLAATIFTATLMVQSKDFRSLAIYACDALKEILEPFDDREMADEWKMYIPPAAAWVGIGGEVLYDLCFKKTSEETEFARFTPESWGVWRDRFAALADDKEIDERCQGLSRTAAEEMKRIEQRV
ncbi:hypothetical protein M436DRAFT_57577 [Aureobasidium namibiae CBS 147.97]|uniref:Uncharacterized protein n=1 Tax=Aureobasidium namibiae CBS 147.97 TaxID=1043004 RepID=A0A074WAZ2_9PEZI